MSLRFTDIRKWKEPWFRKMTPEDKLAFFYIWECCDNAGFIPYDDEVVALQTGIAVNRLPKLWKKLVDRVVIKKDWMWVVDFPRLQKNWPLKPYNNAHKQIIRLLSERREHFKDIPVFSNFVAPAEGLLSSSGIGNGNGSGIGIGSGNGFDKGNSRGQGRSNGDGNGQDHGLEHVNRELQECAATISNSEKAEDEQPF